jgi:hypothetical protein
MQDIFMSKDIANFSVIADEKGVRSYVIPY